MATDEKDAMGRKRAVRFGRETERRTFVITPRLGEVIDRASAKYRIGQSELVRRILVGVAIDFACNGPFTRLMDTGFEEIAHELDDMATVTYREIADTIPEYRERMNGLIETGVVAPDQLIAPNWKTSTASDAATFLANDLDRFLVAVAGHAAVARARADEAEGEPMKETA